ncbi:MAG: WD40 repeat domain-containing protein [Methanomicrobium sp.]|nr:WD40 repeat domain-containing protein [Methanomicrobium sp.]
MSLKISYKISLLASALLILCTVCAVSAAAGQTTGPAYEWEKHIATCGNGSDAVNVTVASVWQMPDGTYIAGGKTDYGRAVFGMDSVGNIQWVRNVSGGDVNGTVRFLQSCPDGGVYLFTDGENLIKLSNASADAKELWQYHLPLGVITSIEVLPHGDILMGGDHLQSFLIKLDTDGNELWNRSLGNPAGGGQFRIRSVQTGNDDKYIVTGYVDPIYYETPYRAFAMEINETGGDVWNQQYKTDNVSILFTSIAPIDNGRYAAGAVESQLVPSLDNGGDAEFVPYVVILDKDGKAVSKKAIDEVDLIYNIQKAADGGLYIFGSKDTPSGVTEHIIVKTDSEGNADWSKNMGDFTVKSIQGMPDNGLLILGTDGKTGESVIIKTEPAAPVRPRQSTAKQSPGFGLITVFAALAAVGGVLAVFGRRKE